jgi:hypothetical protein
MMILVIALFGLVSATLASVPGEHDATMSTKSSGTKYQEAGRLGLTCYGEQQATTRTIKLKRLAAFPLEDMVFS